jgi:NAD(P)H-nitrite reductase large subunit
LNDGTKLDADLVIVGAGVKPETSFLKGSDIKVDQLGAIFCNEFL